MNEDKTMSPLLERVLSQKRNNYTSTRCLWRGGVYCVLTLAMYFEMTFSPVREFFSWRHPYVRYAEGILTLFFCISTCTDWMVYAYSLMAAPSISLTPQQKKLMGVRPQERSFTSSPDQHRSPSRSAQTFSSPSVGHKGSYSNLSLTCSTPQSHSPSPVKSANVSHISYGGTPSGSFLPSSRPGSSMLVTPVGRTPDVFMDTSGLRSRSNASYRQSPASPDSFIADEKSLVQFLREEEDREEKRLACESSSNASVSYWSINRSATDYAPVLRTYPYQVACRNPQSTASPSEDSTDHASKLSSSQVWSKLDILDVQLDSWIANLRYWLNQTIFVRLVTEIDAVNRNLRRIGCSDMLIGEVSTSSLKQIAVTKSQHVPSLNTIVPYLEVSSHQEYLVHRIRELGTGGCMSDYDWNGGGHFKGKSWADHLPTDAAIVVHAFCTYLDARLPANPRYTDGRAFTSVHFVKTPEKPVPSKGSLCLYQTKINPPHFNVILGEDLWEIPKGRHNLFYALIVFLHHIKHKEHGMLGPVNLGRSGVNVLWTLED